MIEPIFCQIRVNGHLSNQWAEWFSGLEIENEPQGQAVLSGRLSDQTALYSVLDRMRDLGLALVSLRCVEAGQDDISHSKNF
jgi:hypothetical protein